jgi:4-amino-4-deoxy-L-arabinose transferase-like glycosyltransferase
VTGKSDRDDRDSGSQAPAGLLWALVAARLAVCVVTAIATPYEFHRDELLYFSMGTHLRLFHMDFPPMIALLSELLRHTVGVSVFTYRLLPGLIGTALFGLTLVIVRTLGGGRRAVFLTALAMVTGPLFLRTASLFQPVVLDQLWWTAALYALLRLEQTDDRQWWWALGVAGGIGLLTKFSIGFVAVGMLLGLLLTPRRRALLGPWPWIAAGVALLLGSPSVLGQVALGFPVVGQLGDLRAGQLARITWGEYLTTQPLIVGPSVLLALAGAGALLTHHALRRYRSVGIACVATFLLLGVLHGKPYYAGPVYPTLFAAGAVWLEGLPRARLRGQCTWWLSGVAAGYGLVVLPLGLPVVPPRPMAGYAAALRIGAATQTNTGGSLPLPQDYADMLGWKEKAAAVGRVVASLSPEERARTVLFGAN